MKVSVLYCTVLYLIPYESTVPVPGYATGGTALHLTDEREALTRVQHSCVGPQTLQELRPGSDLH